MKIMAIKDIKPYQITLQWSDELVRVHELSHLLVQYPTLQDVAIFAQATIEEGALAWENILIEVKLASQTLHLPLVLDKQVLHETGVLVGKVWEAKAA
jgi:hypothetical protein